MVTYWQSGTYCPGIPTNDIAITMDFANAPITLGSIFVLYPNNADTPTFTVTETTDALAATTACSHIKGTLGGEFYDCNDISAPFTASSFDLRFNVPATKDASLCGIFMFKAPC